MTQATGNSDPRVIEAIRHAIELDSKGERELAMRHLSELISEFPTVASIHGYLAWFSYRSGQFDKAIEHGRQAILLSPKSEKASLMLFRALWRAGRHIEALDEMKRLLSMRPSDEYSKMINEWELGDSDKPDMG